MLEIQKVYTYKDLQRNNVSKNGTDGLDPAIVLRGLGNGGKEFPSVENNAVPEDDRESNVGIVQCGRVLDRQDDREN